MKFNLNDYATVEERLRAFWADEANQDARIVTKNHTVDGKTWIIEARLYITAGDQSLDLAKTTGWASEANTDPFALERCETSAIGRMLANYHYSGSKKGDKAPRPSREEMEKVVRNRDWMAEAKGKSLEELRTLYAEAKAVKVSPDILKHIEELASGSRNTEGKLQGVAGSPTVSQAKK